MIASRVAEEYTGRVSEPTPEETPSMDCAARSRPSRRQFVQGVASVALLAGCGPLPLLGLALVVRRPYTGTM